MLEPDFDPLRGTFLGWACEHAVDLVIIACVLVVVVFGAVIQ